MKSMKAIILAGGKGLRLRDIIRNMPKPMAPVNGKPFLEYLIIQLIRWKVNEILLSIGHKSEVIKSYFGDGEKWGIKIQYSEEKEPLGTGGALKKALELIDEHDFIVMNGDSFFDLDFDKFISFYKSKRAIGLIGLALADNVSRYGKIEVKKSGEIIRFAEKGESGYGLINAGIYILSKKIFDRIPAGKASLEVDVFPNLLSWGLYGMVVDNFFVDIGAPQEYLNLCKDPARLIDAVTNRRSQSTLKSFH